MTVRRCLYGPLAGLLGLLAGGLIGGCGRFSLPVVRRLPASAPSSASATRTATSALNSYVYGTPTTTTPSSASIAAAGLPDDPAKVALANRTHEYPPATPPPAERGIGSATPAAAVRAFATAYINWTAATLPADLHALAAASVGQARSAVQIQAADLGANPSLVREGVSNSGTVEAVAPLASGGDRYVVVTRESTRASRSSAYAGLQPAWHVTVATVRQDGPRDWVLSGWQPES